MLKRKIEEKLELWWNSNTALLVDGARQVGKTFILEEFAKRKTTSYIYLNFIEQPHVIPQLIRSRNTEEFIFNLSTVINQPLIRNHTIIFFDEIQHIYQYMREHQIHSSDFDLITLMKFLVKEGSYRYILSGSLMGIMLSDIASWPTGYMTAYRMYPMDFEEFLWANGIQQNVIDHVKDCFEQRTEADPYVHEKFLSLFQKYILVGGMPAAVNNFVGFNDMNMVELAHQNIEQYNRRDITKYAPPDKRFYISQIYDLLPEELNKQNKRFTLGLLKNKNHHEIIEDSFLWLVNAGIAIPVYSADEPVIPLRIASNRRLLKLFHEDCGLLTYQYLDSSLKTKILNNEKSINFGAIYENAVAQLLTAHGYQYLNYYNKKDMGEIDFLIEYQGKVLPLEIKSGKDYTRHSAANNLLKTYEEIDEVFVLNSVSNIRTDGQKVYLPIYMAEMIRRNH